jgi:hypothetical protein
MVDFHCEATVSGFARKIHSRDHRSDDPSESIGCHFVATRYRALIRHEARFHATPRHILFFV